MIINLKKVLFLGASEDLDLFFKRAQEAECVQFLTTKRQSDYADSTQKLIKALKILGKAADVSPQNLHDETPPVEIAERVLFLQHDIDKKEERERLLEAEIARIAPFGSFSLEEIKLLEEQTGHYFQFYGMKDAKYFEEGAPDNLVLITIENGMAYFISFNPEKNHFPGLIELKFDHSLSELKRERVRVEQDISNDRQALITLTNQIDRLKEALVAELNHAHLENAKKEALPHLDSALFAIEGYVPENKKDVLFNLLEGLAVHVEPIRLDEQEMLPTYMENSGFGKVGEDLVHIYDTPAPTDPDPSPWVFWAFILFFSLIVSDGGYGFLYLILGLILKFKVKSLKGSMKRLSTLVISLGIGCVLWGFCTSSFFGVSLAPHSWLTRISLVHALDVRKADYHMAQKDDVYEELTQLYPDLLNAKTGEEFLQLGTSEKEGKVSYDVVELFNDNLFLEISLLMGIAHITLSLMRFFRRNFANAGWICFLIGGYLFFPSMLNATSLVNFLGLIDKSTAQRVGLEMLTFGIGFATIVALIQHRLGGILELTKSIQIFSDVLSYLRLYALGLAGMIMASTFNGIGSAAGFFFGALIILAGHAVNITLAVMGGVIHGLRLNFLEWYHYSFEGGGKLFNPLRLIKRSTL